MSKPDITDWTYWALLYALITQLDTIVAKIEKAGDVDEHDVQNLTELVTDFKSLKPEKN
ncbi:hypothetical protein PGC08_05785 [Brevibacterium sp. BDJS002]|uniref:hypothetical protein n=1 Tax=Brevibacterium sp. BDJS002 TaxID=3020906 RepID=UPI002307419E|nr:hypothetical protein [Brevibacterium sp. BDJS002]WCE41193.1 hypothetical protein PGC08_05785 [Brevibacterium sp. BDJS002]